jgi:hypothetical protein
MSMATLAITQVAAGGATHTYSVSLAISVDKAAHKIKGTVVTDAPPEFCDSSTIRVRRVKHGRDDVFARVTPYGGEWHLKSPSSLRGKRVYAEVSGYHLPGRPVVCLAGRSRTVTAP